MPLPTFPDPSQSRRQVCTQDPKRPAAMAHPAPRGLWGAVQGSRGPCQLTGPSPHCSEGEDSLASRRGEHQTSVGMQRSSCPPRCPPPGSSRGLVSAPQKHSPFSRGAVCIRGKPSLYIILAEQCPQIHVQLEPMKGTLPGNRAFADIIMTRPSWTRLGPDPMPVTSQKRERVRHTERGPQRRGWRGQE